jgi:hypothetical protein
LRPNTGFAYSAGPAALSVDAANSSSYVRVHDVCVITLADMQARGMTMLAVACRRCERRGRLKIARLIAEHGGSDHDLRRLIAHDCPRMQDPSVSIYERCGIHFPELPKWF